MKKLHLLQNKQKQPPTGRSGAFFQSPLKVLLQILQVGKGNVVFQIFQSELIVQRAVGVCDGRFMPDFLFRAHGSGNDGIGFLLPVLALP